VLIIFTVTLVTGCSEMNVGSTENTVRKNRVRLEHVAINVEDPVSMAKWYGENLGMKLVRKGPPPINMHFISDAGGNMMLEIYHNPPDAVPDYSSMNPLLLHISFMVDDVKSIREKLIAAGATAVGEVTITSSGDELAMLRDPWGVAIQFVKRAKPMLRN
jgi:catechol 2,3-dioxygenase-like lactoylglutathione lyase family enzyme